ncbi:hypothetical protein V8C44DRAFT_306785 [Trichoderma aethiopicum]
MGNGHSSSKRDPRKNPKKESRKDSKRESKKDSRKESSRRDHKKSSKGTSSRHESSSHRSDRNRHRHSHSHSHSHGTSHGTSHNQHHRNTIHMANTHDVSQEYAHQRMDFVLQLFQDPSFVPQIHPMWERMGEDARRAALKVRDRGSAVTAPERDEFVRMLYTAVPEAPEAMGYGYDTEEDRLYSREASPVVNALGIMNNEPASDQDAVRRHSMFPPSSSVYSTDVESAPRSRGRSLSPLIPQAASFPPSASAPEAAPPLRQETLTDHRDRRHSHSRSQAGPSSEGERYHRQHSHSRSHARESSRERAKRRPRKPSSSSRRN